jgi:HD superfamily phosphodiesterase
MRLVACATAITLLGSLLTASAFAADAPAAADWRTKLQTLARDNFRNPAWGYSHSQRIYRLATDLAARDGVTVDDDVVYAAAFLHDIAAFPPWYDAERDHADVATEVVVDILRDAGFPAEKTAAVRGAIRTHMYFRDPSGAEAMYIHDADALDWLGAVGAARMLALADPKGGAPDGPATVKMIQDNHAKVPGRLFSAAGKALEAERRRELESFLTALGEQTAGFSEL